MFLHIFGVSMATSKYYQRPSSYFLSSLAFTSLILVDVSSHASDVISNMVDTTTTTIYLATYFILTTIIGSTSGMRT